MIKNGFAVALVLGFLEMGEMRPLCLSAVSGDDSVSALGASIGVAFFGLTYMDDASVFIASNGV